MIFNVRWLVTIISATIAVLLTTVLVFSRSGLALEVVDILTGLITALAATIAITGFIRGDYESTTDKKVVVSHKLRAGDKKFIDEKIDERIREIYGESLADPEAISNSIKDLLRNELSDELRREMAESLDRVTSIEAVQNIFSNQIDHLTNAIAKSRANASSNRIYGILVGATTIFGMAIWLSLVPSDSNLNIEILKLIGRTSLTILAAILVFFFLQQSRASFSEAKFFENERNTILAVQTAFKIAIHEKDKKLIAFVVKRLAGLERNGTNAKDTTVAEAALVASLGGELSTALQVLANGFSPFETKSEPEAKGQK